MVGIVIINYNGEKFQNDCIKSLFAQTYQDFKIIVIDNGSTDNSMKLLEAFNDDRIIKIYNGDNFGVAKANNIGIKESVALGCTYTLLLNNDTVLEPKMLEYMVNKQELVASPKIYYYGTNKIWYFGGKINKFKGTITHFYYQQEKYEINDYTTYAPTCCLLINNRVFEKTGLFDEEYFLYYDDVDFCYQLEKNNIKIALVNDAVLYHKVSLSSGGENSRTAIYYNNRNRYYFIEKMHGIEKVLSKIYTNLTRLIVRENKDIIKLAKKDFKTNKMGRKEW